MLIGETVEEKRAYYEKMMANADKCKKIFCDFSKILGAGFGLMMVIIGLSDFQIGLILCGILGGLIIAFVSGPMIQNQAVSLYFGFLITKEWMEERGIEILDIVEFVGLGALFSFLIGGRKAAKASVIMSLAAILAAIVVGMFAGQRRYKKMKKEVKELGFV